MSESCGSAWGIDHYRLVRIPIKHPCDGYYLRWWYNGWHYWFFLPGTISFETEGEKYVTLGTQKIAMGSGQVTEGQISAIRTILNSREVYLYSDSGWANVRIEQGSVMVYDNKVSGYEMEFIAVIGSKTVSSSGFTPVTNIVPIEPTPDPSICGVVIGTQVWMCKNYESLFPGSKVYDDDETNRTKYGALYTGNQVRASGFSPTGWHVPTLAEWQTLLTFAGGQAVAGGALKEAGLIHWDGPNTGALDTYGFKALGAGQFGIMFAAYNWVNIRTYFLTATESAPGYVYVIQMDFDTAIATITQVSMVSTFCSVRLVRQAVSGFETLYNWFAIDSGILAPAGWHVPSAAEWLTLYNAVTGGTEIEKSNSICLPDPLYWDNIIGGTNIDGFSMKGSGYRRWDGMFIGATGTAWVWSSTAVSGTEANIVYIALGAQFEKAGFIFKTVGAAVRLIKDATILTDGQVGSVTDIDGNVYPTICIGTQEWMADSLKVEHYNNGTDIPEVTDNATWTALATGARCRYDNNPTVPSALTDLDGNVYSEVTIGSQIWTVENLKVTKYSDGSLIPEITGNSAFNSDVIGARCWYNNDIANKTVYGALYNGYAVENANGLVKFLRAGVYEAGWRVPTDADFVTLSTFLGGDATSGGKLKEVGTSHWTTPNTGADNSSGFTAVPGGFRWNNGYQMFSSCWLWTSSDDGGGGLTTRTLAFNNAIFAEGGAGRNNGISVRCVRDV
jgi:uncharacterized protein (TIGR02145 family)